jgi:hypothetical protein
MQCVPLTAVNRLVATMNRYADLGMRVRTAVWVAPKTGSDDPDGHWHLVFEFRESAATV